MQPSQGKLPEPIIIGQLYMKNLNLPGLKFTNVRGDFKYKDGYIGAQNVTADVFGAPVMPRAVFNIDTKAYDVYVKGHDLHSEDAAGVPLLQDPGPAGSDHELQRDNRSTVTYGTFTSGKGNLCPCKV